MGRVTADWDRAVSEAAEYPPATLEDAAREELAFLWADLAHEAHYAYNGRWSAACDSLVTRIVRLSRLAGPVSWQQISYPLLLSGTWQGITAAAGFNVPQPGEADLQRMRDWMESQRLATVRFGRRA